MPKSKIQGETYKKDPFLGRSKYGMKIQIDQNGKSLPSQSTLSRTTGILLSRKGQRMQVDIGNRTTPHALYSALTHLRSVHCSIVFSTHKQSFAALLPVDKKLNASLACFHLGTLLLQIIEHRHGVFHTKSLEFLTHDINLPRQLHVLSDLRMRKLSTSSALRLLDEHSTKDTSFIIPAAEFEYAEASYRVRKLPQSMRWPIDLPYLPLSFSEILPHPFASWYNSLSHIALCVRRPLIQSAQMKITLKSVSATMTTEEITEMPPQPSWLNITRILYPFAAEQERPENFRLLICSITDDTKEYLL